MKHEIKKILCIALTLILAIGLIPMVFADNTPVIYADMDKSNNTVDIYFEAKTAMTKAEYTFTANSGISITSSQGYSINDGDDAISVLNSESTYVNGSIFFYNIENPVTGKIKVGTFVFSTEKDTAKLSFTDMFTLTSTKKNGVTDNFRLKVINAYNEELSEPSSEFISEIISENVSETVSEPSSEEISEPISEPVSEPESEETSEFSTEPASEPVTDSIEKKYNPTAEIYIYEDLKGDFYGILSVNTDGADTVSFDVKSLKTVFTMGEPEIIGNANGLKAEYDNNIISVYAKGDVTDGFIKIPLKFTSATFAYKNKDILFSLDYCFVNGNKKNIDLTTTVPTFNPVDKSSSYFKGFDATFNTYENGEDTYYSYKLYGVSQGFASDFDLSLSLNDKYTVISVDVPESLTSDIKSNEDSTTTVTIKSNENTSAKIEYTAMATIYFRYTGDEVAYGDFWSNATISSLIIDGIDYTACDMTLKALLGYGYHYDTVDGIVYTSYDYKNQPRYTAVSDYVAESAGENITIPESVREGYIVASVDADALTGCAMKSITLPDTIEKINANAFKNCENLESITIPKNVYIIGNNAFDGCTSLTEVNWKNSSVLETIGDNAFINCISFTDIILPDGKYTIGNHAFAFTYENEKYDIVDGARLLYETGDSPAISYGNEFSVTYINEDEKSLDIIKGSQIVIFVNTDEKYFLVTEQSLVSQLTDIASDYYFVIYNGSEIADNEDKITTGMTAKFAGTSEEYSIVLKGDVDCNGKVNAKDARTMLRTAAKLETLTGLTYTAADLDKNGKISVSEARTILRVSAKIEKF